MRPRRTIYRTLQRFEKEQRIISLPRLGRPKIFNERACNSVKIQARRNPFWTYKQLSASVTNHPSRSTIRRILRPHGLSKRLSKKKIPIGPRLALKRRAFVENGAGFVEKTQFKTGSFRTSVRCNELRTLARNGAGDSSLKHIGGT